MLKLKSWRLVRVLSTLASSTVPLLIHHIAHVLLLEDAVLGLLSHLCSIVLIAKFVDCWASKVTRT